MSEMSTPRKRIEGLGSARHGAGTWKAERLSSLLLVPLHPLGAVAGAAT